MSHREGVPETEAMTLPTVDTVWTAFTEEGQRIGPVSGRYLKEMGLKLNVRNATAAAAELYRVPVGELIMVVEI